MGAPKTQTVGGGNNVQTADKWNQFLQGQMGTGANPGQAGGQTTNFMNLFNGMANQSPDSITQNNPFIKQAQNLPQAPSFSNTNLQNVQGGNVAGMFDPGGGAPGYTDNNLNSLMQQFSRQAAQAQGNTGQYQAGQAFTAQAGQGQGFGVNFDPNELARISGVLGQPNTIGGLLNTTNDPEIKQYGDYLNRRATIDQANNAAKYSLGGRGLSTAASQSNAQFAAENAGQNVRTLGDLSRQKQQLDITNRGQNIAGLLGQRQQDIGMRGEDINALMAARQATAGNMTNASLTNAGLFNQANMFNAGNLTNTSLTNAGRQGDMSLANAGMLNQTGMYNAGQQNQQNQFGMGQAANTYQANQNANIQRMAQVLQARGMDANTALQAAMANNQFGLDRSGQRNQFNMNMFGQNSQNAMNQGQLGLGIQQLLQSGNQNLINQLFSGMQQSNQIGSPQAQTIQTPNDWQNAIGGINDVMGIAGNVMKMFNGMPPSSQAPSGMDLINGQRSSRPSYYGGGPGVASGIPYNQNPMAPFMQNQNQLNAFSRPINTWAF